MRRRRAVTTPEIPIAPMIDCVFLMLVYFMTTSSLEKSEAEMVYPAGGGGAVVTDPLPSVDEQVLFLDGGGRVLWNGSTFGILGGAAERGRLGERLGGFAAASTAAGSEATVNIRPEGEAPHQALVHVLDLVTGAGIEQVRIE